MKIFMTIFGLLVGSFLNVVIYRIPREQSVVTPRSSCPNCAHQIKWYENVPVISYLFLVGKCRGCKTSISIQYPLVELLMGIIAFFLAPNHITPIALINFVFYFSVACIFVSHFIIDLEFQILPDKINYYFLAISIPFAAVYYAPGFWILGGLIGFLGPFMVTYAFYKLRGQMGLGGGDIKLYGILGILLGPLGIMKTIFLSCMLGSVVGITLILTKKMNKDTPLAFGPYILIIAAIQIFAPNLLEYIDPFKF